MAKGLQRYFNKVIGKYLPEEEYDSDEEYLVLADDSAPGGVPGGYRPKRAASSKALEALHKAAEDALKVSDYMGSAFEHYRWKRALYQISIIDY